MIHLEARALLFDMDGTMIDNKEFHDKAWIMFCQQHAPAGFDLQGFMAHFYGKTNKQLLAQVFGRSLDDDEVTYYEEIKESTYRSLYAPHIRLVDGLYALLDKARSLSIPCAVTTSAPLSNVDFVLDHTQTRHLFSLVVDASMVTSGKPSPQVYLKAVEMLGLPAAHCVAFEDSRAGVASALGAKIKTIGLCTDLDELIMKSLHVSYCVKNFTEISLQLPVVS